MLYNFFTRIDLKSWLKIFLHSYKPIQKSGFSALQDFSISGSTHREMNDTFQFVNFCVSFIGFFVQSILLFGHFV